MLCPSCRRQLSRGDDYCGSCGAPLEGGSAPLELVLSDATRVPVVDTVTIGRAPGNSLQLADPSVSRSHARISAGNGHGTVIEDTGSSHGTYVDGQRVTRAVPLHDGAKIRIGDAELHVERRRTDAEEGKTIVVKAGATLMVSAAGAAGLSAQATQFGMKPRVRSGYALKRLDESEGALRWVLRDLNTDKFRRMDDTDAELFKLLDGRHSLVDLIGLAEQRVGPAGPGRLARLLSDLGERGFLHGVAGSTTQHDKPPGFFKKLMGPREKVFTGVGEKFDALYRKGGWVLFTKPALSLFALLVVGGLVSFLVLLFGRYGTPFVVSEKIGIGGLVFLLGRFAFVAVHETAHGLAMSSFGRRVQRAGFKLMFIFPYAFVDTSEAWFETRRARLKISGAGPVSDLSLGGSFSVLCLVWPEGTVRDIFFNLAFAGYIGAIFNLNPFLDRDGYHMAVDVLQEPQLRKRAREQLARRISGKGTQAGDSPVLFRYAVLSVGWLVVMGAFVIFITRRYAPIMEAYAPEAAVKGVLYTLYVVVFLPVLFTLGRPLFERFRRGEPEPA